MQSISSHSTAINNTSAIPSTSDEMYGALNAKLEKFTLDLEQAKNNGKVNHLAPILEIVIALQILHLVHKIETITPTEIVANRIMFNAIVNKPARTVVIIGCRRNNSSQNQDFPNGRRL